MTLFRGDLEEMCHRLDILEGGYGVLIWAAMFAVDTLGPSNLSLSTRLWRLLEQVERAVEHGGPCWRSLQSSFVLVATSTG